MGAIGDDDGGADQGAVWIFFLNSDGTVASERKISETAGGSGFVLDPGERFGSSVAALDDLDGDGYRDLAVGAYLDDDGGNDQGAVWMLFLEGPRRTRRFSGTLGSAVVTYPLQGGPSVPPPSRPSDILQQGAELELELSHPLGAPILRLEVADVRVVLSDGSTEHVLYAPAPKDEGRTMSVFADLSVLFPRSTSETEFRLMAHARSERAFVGQPHFQGGAKLRNGRGSNKVSFVSACSPRAGEEWQAWVDASAHTKVSASLVSVTERPLAGRNSSFFGEVLVDVASRPPLFVSRIRSEGGTDVHTMHIPLEALGRTFSLQALVLDQRGLSLTNAVDLSIQPPR